MTTDRTALEAARDALPPLPASHYVPDTDPAFTAQQMRDYAAPQEAAPALDDARDADTKRLDWLEQSEARNQWIVAKGADSFTVSPGRRQHATRKTIREAIDAAMQQEPRS